MRIHGVRLYPASVQIERGVGDTPIFVHGRLDENRSDFSYIFDPVANLWKGQVFARQIETILNENGTKSVTSWVEEEFGESIAAVDLESEVMLLRGEDFKLWAKNLMFGQGTFFPVFWESPSCEILRSMCREYDYCLTSVNWPGEMRGFIHLCDNVYWELYSTIESDVQTLVRAHAGDSKLKMYYVDLYTEYPTPSGTELAPI